MGAAFGSFEGRLRAKNFLLKIWRYESPDARCFSIVAIGQGTEFEHFCLDRYSSLDELVDAAVDYVARNYSRWLDSKMHVYFQVLPLAERPAKGRGNAQQVKVGRWLFLDLDYKESFKDKPPYLGCSELEDYALECYYQEGNNVRHVKRPSLGWIIANIERQLGDKPTIVVDSGNGYHVYLKLSREIEAQELARLLELLVNVMGGDPQAKDLARILRLPGTINPRVLRTCEVIHEAKTEFEPEKLRERLERLSKEEASERRKQRKERQERDEEKRGSQKLRELTDSDIVKIASLLEPVYTPGRRQLLLLYLAGWLARANVHPVSAVKLVKYLYDKMGDTDPLKTRLGAVVYTYKKAGIDIDAYASEIKTLAGVKPYGLEKEIKEAEIKGMAGLQELLEEILGEERTLAVLHELSEILKSYSPYGESIVVRLDAKRQLYAVANLKTFSLHRAERDENRLVYREEVANVCPIEVIVYTNPVGGIRKYEITFMGRTLDKPLVIGPAYLKEIIERVRTEGFVKHRLLIEDVLTAVVQGFEEKGRAIKRISSENPGFYITDEGLVAVKYDVESPLNVEGLKEAIGLLNELAEKWYTSNVARSRLALILKWGAVAPFSYIMKTGRLGGRRMLPWLYLYGESGSGKSTLGKIVLNLWGLDSEYEKDGGHLNTEARFTRNVSSSTFPILVNEPVSIFMKPEVVELLKHAVDGENVRGKYVQGVYVEYPALAPIIFASNKFVPNEPGIRRRIVLVEFSPSDVKPKPKQEEFRDTVEPHLNKLAEIGRCIAKQVFDNPKILVEKKDPLEAGEELLHKCYKLAGAEAPEWLKLMYTPDDLAEHYSLAEQFRTKLIDLINSAYARLVDKTVYHGEGREERIRPEDLEIQKKLEILLTKKMLAGAELHQKKSGEKVVVFTKSFFTEILKYDIIMKSLAETLGWSYGTIKLAGHTVKAIEVPYKQLIQFISSSSIEEEESSSSPE